MSRWCPIAIATAALAAATVAAFALEPRVSTTSIAMFYLVAVVVTAYATGRTTAVVTAFAAVAIYNYGFVPPRFDFAVDSAENVVALATMLGVALLISWLSGRLRAESATVAIGERRARQQGDFARELLGAADEAAAVAAATRVLAGSFDRVRLALVDASGELPKRDDVDGPTRQALQRAVVEAAPLGPGTGRWPDLSSWIVPFGTPGRVLGSVEVGPAATSDMGRLAHAVAIANALAQALARLRSDRAQRDAELDLGRERMQNTFLASVAHDLRTPLQAITTAASSLVTQEDKLSADDRARRLTGIAHQAAHLARIADDTLELARLAGGPIDRRSIDWQSLEEVVGSVVSRRRAGGRALTQTRVRVARGLPLVRGNATLLAQLVDNLLDNAHGHGAPPVRLVCGTSGAEVVLAVSDRGGGVAGDDRDRMFEPFVRGAGARATAGVGLGLALCRAVAEAHHGRLSHQPRRGGGSRFVLRLPVEPQPAVAEATRP